jgi:hypothetical protein
MGITNDDFMRILLKLCKKIISLSDMKISLIESIPKELNAKYKECQKIVDFLKQIGFKSDLNLNNILFPSIRDMQRVFEFTLEYITNSETGGIDIGQNISEKSYSRVKLQKTLNTWIKDSWLMPEFREKTDDIPYSILKYDNNMNTVIKKKIQGNQIDDRSNI